MSKIKKIDVHRSKFEAFALDYLDVLYTTAFYLTKSKFEAEYLVQETYRRAAHFFKLFHAGSNLLAWILEILFDCHQGFQVGKVDELSTTGAKDMESPHATTLDVEDKNYSRAFRKGISHDEISQALQRIPNRLCAVLLLVDINGLSYKETASILKWSKDTVMSQLSRARKKLRQILIASN